MITSASGVTSASPLISALQAIGSRTQQVANNVANVNTPDYQAERGAFVSQQSVGRGVSYVALQAQGGVDLTSQFVDLIAANLSYKAAAESFGSITRTEQKAYDLMA
jgi:flagellar basal body rod protein FlgB